MNHMPSLFLGFKCPLELFSCSFLWSFLLPKAFYCICYVYVPKSDYSKLDPKALKCIFLEYAPNQKGYKCCHSSIHKRFVSMDVSTSLSLFSLLANLIFRGKIDVNVKMSLFFMLMDVVARGRKNK